MYFLIAQKRVHAKCSCQQMINFDFKNRSSRRTLGLTFGISAIWISWCCICVFSKISEGETGTCACENIQHENRYWGKWNRKSPDCCLCLSEVSSTPNTMGRNWSDIGGSCSVLPGSSWSCSAVQHVVKLPRLAPTLSLLLTWDKELTLLVEAGKTFLEPFQCF